jgi:glycine/D-amino acid oxidase-like deaminating enzyme
LPERVTEVLVGLRPYRRQGFVVRAEPLGDKMLVHNYGHGGAGITLSWGCAQQAVDLARSRAASDCAVIGCGVIGLTTATLLQRRGARVTIYTDALPPANTSHIAGGHWSPYSVFDSSSVDDEFMRQFNDAVVVSFRAFEALAGQRGVSWRRNFSVTDDPEPLAPRYESLRGLLPGMRAMGPGEHPFGRAHVQAFTSLMIEPAVFLRTLLDDFLEAGGELEVRRLASPQELSVLRQSVVFNCTGLGARELMGDLALTAARGQLVKLEPQPEVDYNLFADGMYMFPRSDGIVLGGSFEVDNWSLEPVAATTGRILARAAKAMQRLAA